MASTFVPKPTPPKKTIENSAIVCVKCNLAKTVARIHDVHAGNFR